MMTKVMLLAAGRGLRLRPLSDNIPKPLVKVGGRSLIARHLDNLAAAGFREVVINVSHRADKIIRALGDGEKFGLRIRYSPEPRALETAGGIACALPLLGDAPFMAINADIFFTADFAALRRRAQNKMRKNHGALAYLALVKNPPHNRGGDFVLDGDFVRPIRRGEEDKKTLTFSGAAVYAPAFFSGVHPRRKRKIAPLLARAAKQGRVCGEYLQGEWHDAGTLQRLRTLRRRLSKC
jgi:MurNAc alpha-1-phosphate uridylyltransferase